MLINTTRQRQRLFAMVSALALAACQAAPPTGPSPGAPMASPPADANAAAPAVVPAVPASPASSALVLPGRVAAAGRPLANASLVLFDAVANQPIALAAPVTTDADGNFALPLAALEEGTVIRVVATAEDGRTLTTLLSRLTPEAKAAYRVAAVGDSSVFSFEDDTSSATHRLVLDEATTLLSHMASGPLSLSAPIRASRGPAARAQANVLRGVLGQLDAATRYFAGSREQGDRLLKDTGKTGLPGAGGTAARDAANLGAGSALTALVQLVLQADADQLKASPSTVTFDVAPLPLIGTPMQAALQGGGLAVTGLGGATILLGGGAPLDPAFAAIARIGAATSSGSSSGGASGGSTAAPPTPLAANTLLRYAGAGQGAWGGTSDVAVDASGNRYIAESGQNRVRKVTPAGEVSIVAGDGTAGFGGDNGPATAAQLSNPTHVAMDAAGNLYISDTSNQRIRKVTAADGHITTLAGTGASGFSGDTGPATAAQLSTPRDVEVDNLGNLYIADSGNARVRKVDANGVITTVAGDGTTGPNGENVTATSAQLSGPSGLAVGAGGVLYIADSGNARIRKVDANGVITTVAGAGTSGFGGDGASALLAALNDPADVEIDGAGNLYIADTGNNRIRKVTAADGKIATIAGNGTATVHAADTVATSAAFAGPSGVAVDANGNVYSAETTASLVRKVTPAGALSVVAGVDPVGKGDGGPALKAVLGTDLGTDYGGLAFDGGGNLYLANPENGRIRKVTAATGVITTVAGNGTFGFSGDGGPATAAQIGRNCYSVAVDASGNIYLADTSNQRVRKVTASTGIITTIAGNGGLGSSGDGGPATAAQLYVPDSVAIDGSGNVYLSDEGGRIRKVDAATGIITTIAGTGVTGYSGDGGPATAARIGSYVSYLMCDGSGNLYIADYDNSCVRKVDASGVITTVAGNGSSGFSGDGGLATAAQLGSPAGLALNGSGDLYVLDDGNHRVRKVAAATGIITTVAGTGTSLTGAPTGEGGSPLNAQFDAALGLAIDKSGAVYVYDLGRVVRFRE